MKVVNPSSPQVPTPAERIVQLLARMAARERLRNEIARKNSATGSKPPVSERSMSRARRAVRTIGSAQKTA